MNGTGTQSAQKKLSRRPTREDQGRHHNMRNLLHIGAVEEEKPSFLVCKSPWRCLSTHARDVHSGSSSPRSRYLAPWGMRWTPWPWCSYHRIEASWINCQSPSRKLHPQPKSSWLDRGDRETCCLPFNWRTPFEESWVGDECAGKWIWRERGSAFRGIHSRIWKGHLISLGVWTNTRRMIGRGEGEVDITGKGRPHPALIFASSIRIVFWKSESTERRKKK